MDKYVCVCPYLCPRDGTKGIGGSQDRVVVHDRLWGHHGNASHLMTHLRGELDRDKVENGTCQQQSTQRPLNVSDGRSLPFRTQALGVLS